MQAVNFPFIKSGQFEELNCPNNEKLNRRLKQEFFLYLNCYKWRHMNFSRNGTAENPYCIFELKEKILYVKANADLIKIFREVMQKFENIPAELII